MSTTWMPSTAGMLTIAAGVVEIIGAWPLGWLVRGIVGFGTSGATEIPIPLIAIPVFAIGVVAVIGGVSAIHQKDWGLALAGSVCAVIVFPLGVPAVIFLSLSKSEFVN